MYIMEREIRMAGHDPNGDSGAGILTPNASSIRIALAQLPRLRGYFSRNLLISHEPAEKVVTTNLVFYIFWAGLA